MRNASCLYSGSCTLAPDVDKHEVVSHWQEQQLLAFSGRPLRNVKICYVTKHQVCFEKCGLRNTLIVININFQRCSVFALRKLTQEGRASSVS